MLATKGGRSENDHHTTQLTEGGTHVAYRARLPANILTGYELATIIGIWDSNISHYIDTGVIVPRMIGGVRRYDMRQLNEHEPFTERFGHLQESQVLALRNDGTSAVVTVTAEEAGIQERQP